ncbi:hypothetical protein Tco_1531951 [Tanacetum coccineum]
MDFENYKEGQFMQRPPLFEANGFIYWKNRFETYVKSKDIDLWHIIVDGDYKPTFRNTSTGRDETLPHERLIDDNKKMLSKTNEAKMVFYNALPKKEYEKIFMTSRSSLDEEENSSDNHMTTKRTFEKQRKTRWESDSDEDEDLKKDKIYLMAHESNEVFLKVKLEPDEWIKDSG